MRVCILGAGAVAYGTAACLRQNGHEPIIWSPSGRRVAEFLSGHPLHAAGAISGTFLVGASLSCGDAIGNADAVVIAVPGYAHKHVIDAAAPFIKDGQAIIISSHLSFSSLYLSKVLAERGVRPLIIVWGTTLTTGKQKTLTQINVGKLRQGIEMATLPETAFDRGHELCVKLFGNRFRKRDGLLAIALSNLNPQNHLGIALFNLTRMEHGEEWSQSGNATPTVGRLIEALDTERLDIANFFGLNVKTVREHYAHLYDTAQTNVSAMNQDAFRRGLGASGPKSADSRYILEDVPFGLVPMVALGAITKTSVALHESGVAILSAAYGRDFTRENDILRKRKLKAAWTWMAPLSKVMSVTSSGGDYFGHRRYKSVEPQGPTELHKGVSTAGCSRGMRARNLRGQTRAGARAESQHGVQVAPATEGWAVQRGGKRHDSIVARNVA